MFAKFGRMVINVCREGSKPCNKFIPPWICWLLAIPQSPLNILCPGGMETEAKRKYQRETERFSVWAFSHSLSFLLSGSYFFCDLRFSQCAFIFNEAIVCFKLPPYFCWGNNKFATFSFIQHFFFLSSSHASLFFAIFSFPSIHCNHPSPISSFPLSA